MISGSIPSGTIDNPEGVEEGDIIIKSPFTVVARIVTYEGDSASSSPVDITSWGTGSALGSEKTYTDVDLLHTSASGIDSFSIVYGVYGNISSSDAPNSSVMISTSDSGWTVDGSKSDGPSVQLLQMSTRALDLYSTGKMKMDMSLSLSMRVAAR